MSRTLRLWMTLKHVITLNTVRQSQCVGPSMFQNGFYIGPGFSPNVDVCIPNGVTGTFQGVTFPHNVCCGPGVSFIGCTIIGDLDMSGDCGCNCP